MRQHLVALDLADLCRTPKPRLKPPLSQRQNEMRQRMTYHPPKLARPVHVVTPRERAEKKGYRDGLNNSHYFPKLNFETGSEWIAWFRGWKRGQDEYRRRNNLPSTYRRQMEAGR